MSKIRYCSLEEAWGEIPTPINTTESLKKERKDVLPVRDTKFECQMEPLSIPKEEPGKMYEHLDEHSKDFLTNLEDIKHKYKITPDDYNNILQGVSRVVENAKKTSITKEDFSNQYAPYQMTNNNQSYDILFLILLGLFIIYVLDRR